MHCRRRRMIPLQLIAVSNRVEQRRSAEESHLEDKPLHAALTN